MAIPVKIAAEPVASDGPSMEQYLETRFNMLDKTLDKMESALRERITAVEQAGFERKKAIDARFVHQEEVTKLIKESADTATQKAEAAQHAHNIASNEWRQTVQDFKDDTTSRTEFDRLASDFAAYKLEIATTVAAAQIRESSKAEGSKDQRTDSRTSISMIVGVAVGVATLISILVGAFIHPPTPIVAAPQAQAPPVMQIPPGYVLVPAQK